MKVRPIAEKGNSSSSDKMRDLSKADQYLTSLIHMFMYCIGLNPYKFNKETGEVSFKWISWETIWALARLIVFNAPFSFLPIILLLCFGAEEFKPTEEMSQPENTTSQDANATTQHISTSTVWLAVISIEYISCYSYFILFRAAKKWTSDFWDVPEHRNRFLFFKVSNNLFW